MSKENSSNNTVVEVEKLFSELSRTFNSMLELIKDQQFEIKRLKAKDQVRYLQIAEINGQLEEMKQWKNN